MPESNQDLVDKVMAKIANGKISPLPQSHFSRSNVLRWLMATIFVFVMGHSLGVLFYFLFDFDYSLLWLYLGSPIKSFMLFSLVIWVALLAVAFTIANGQYRKTSLGYRTETSKLKGIIFLGTIIIGTVSYQSKLSLVLDRVFGEHVPFYFEWQKQKLHVWSQPEKGLLSGRIISVEKASIVITDLTGRVWQVQIKDAMIRHRVQLRKDEVVKLIGRSEGGNHFVAQEVRPWQGRRMQMKHCLERGAALQDCINNHGGDSQNHSPP